MKNKFVKILFLVMICCLFNSCAMYIRPEVPETQLNQQHVEQIKKKLEEKYNLIQAYKTLSRTRLDYQNKKMAFKHAVVAKRDDVLRIDTLPQMGAYTLGALYVDDDGVIAVDPVKKEVYLSNNEVSLIAKAVGVPLRRGELFSYLIAEIPLEELQKNNIDIFQYKNGDYLAIFNQGEKYWRFDKKNLLLKEAWLYSKFNNSLLVKFDYQIPANDNMYMQKISFEIDGVKAELFLTSIEVNPNLESKKIKLKVPQGYKSHRLVK